MAIILMIAHKDWALRDAANYLAHQGHRVFTEESGAKGLEMALAAPPDVLLVDMCIAYVDGFEIVAEVARKYPDRHVPTVMRTHKGGNGEPWRGWEVWGEQRRAWVDSYVMRGGSHWQIVLSVEQLLHYSLTPKRGADPA